MLGYVDRLVLRDELPNRRNRSGQRSMRQFVLALQVLADWLATYRGAVHAIDIDEETSPSRILRNPAR